MYPVMGFETVCGATLTVTAQTQQNLLQLSIRARPHYEPGGVAPDAVYQEVMLVQKPTERGEGAVTVFQSDALFNVGA